MCSEPRDRLASGPVSEDERRDRPPQATADRDWLAALPDENMMRPVCRAPGAQSWRSLRILGEFVDGFEEMMHVGPAVAMFGAARGAGTQPGDQLYEQSREIARRLGESGLAIITGGGRGLMEACNRGAREAGVESVGLTVQPPFGPTNEYVTTSLQLKHFFVRKMLLSHYAYGFVCLPGGMATLNELTLTVTLMQYDHIRAFPVVLYGRDRWRGLIEWMRAEGASDARFDEEELDRMQLADTPEEAHDLIVEGLRPLVADGRDPELR
jgi:uncharacterized protein (TIGR00730 family)